MYFLHCSTEGDLNLLGHRAFRREYDPAVGLMCNILLKDISFPFVQDFISDFPGVLGIVHGTVLMSLPWLWYVLYPDKFKNRSMAYRCDLRYLGTPMEPHPRAQPDREHENIGLFFRSTKWTV
ncbi:hypothetical protein QBC45DRAFT_435066 [Copromyces sp. CBS 386.78]|nr:hypothetical protein QBC45DRAFT_435066 [Copromyces sp. CBS 386.78]